jgi:hypothetical protein
MCNCNKSRSAFNQANNYVRPGALKVKLTDNTPVVVSGNYTGRNYRFMVMGHIYIVDSRDAESVTGNPHLEIVEN